jgi:hypothetical protein
LVVGGGFGNLSVKVNRNFGKDDLQATGHDPAPWNRQPRYSKHLRFDEHSGQGISLQCEGAHIVSGQGVVFRPVHDGNGGIRLGYIACWRPDNSNPVLKNFFDTLPR